MDKGRLLNAVLFLCEAGFEKDALKHSIRVGRSFFNGKGAFDESCFVVGLFHDILEDIDGARIEGRALFVNNKAFILSDDECVALHLLNRKAFDGTYKEYIKRIKDMSVRSYGGDIAKAVKLADLRDNLNRSFTDPEHYDHEKGLKLKPRYIEATVSLKNEEE